MRLHLALKYYRRRANLTQVTISESMGVSPSLIAKWEQGLISPKAAQLAHIAKLCGCSLADLLGDQPTEQGSRMALQVDSLDAEVKAALVSLVSALSRTGRG